LTDEINKIKSILNKKIKYIKGHKGQREGSPGRLLVLAFPVLAIGYGALLAGEALSRKPE
jgi:hypothetical protein